MVSPTALLRIIHPCQMCGRATTSLIAFPKVSPDTRALQFFLDLSEFLLDGFDSRLHSSYDDHGYEVALCLNCQAKFLEAAAQGEEKAKIDEEPSFEYYGSKD